MSADLAIKEPCRVATSASITLSGLQTIDGVTVAAGDRILVKAQSTATQNGIYTAASGAWSRSTDFDAAGEVVGGTQVLVTSGNVRADRIYAVTGNGPFTPGTHAIAFERLIESAGIAGAGLFTGLGAQDIPAAVQMIRTTGYSEVGRGAAWYSRDAEQTALTAIGGALVNARGDGDYNAVAAAAAVATLESYFRKQDAGGAWWRLAEERPTSDMFGTVGNADYDPRDRTVTGGTVVTDNLQALVDYGIHYGRCPVHLSPGGHLTDDTLHIGYGDEFVQVELIGPGAINGLLPADRYAGAFIHCTETDRPTINIQGGRDIRLAGFGIGGVLADKIENWGFGQLRNPFDPEDEGEEFVDDTDPANWDDTGVTDSRYTPYAAVTIDAFSGNLASGYTVSRPAWVPYGDEAYGDSGIPLSDSDPSRKTDTSGIVLERLWVAGFTVAFMSNPSNSPNQGDFLKIRNCGARGVKYVVSVGNSQSRCVSVEDGNFALYYCAFTNRQHGAQVGQYGGTILNTAMGAGIWLFDFNLATCGPVKFQNSYCEAQWALGMYLIGGSGDTVVTFDHCSLGFGMAGDLDSISTSLVFGGAAAQRGLPGAMIKCMNADPPGSVGSAPFRFVGGHIQCINTCALMAKCEFDGTSFHQTTREPETEPYLAEYHNALAGGIAMPKLDGRDYPHGIKFSLYDLDTQLFMGAYKTGDGWKASNRGFGTPIYCRTIRAEADERYEDIPGAKNGYEVAKDAFLYGDTPPDPTPLVGRLLTFYWPGATRAYHGAILGIGPGSAMLDPATGSVFAIATAEDVTIPEMEPETPALKVVAVLQNNYRDDGFGNAVPIEPFDLENGAWFFNHCRLYTLPRPHLATFTATNATLSNVQRGDTVTELTGEIAAGDVLDLDPQRRPLLAHAGAGEITSFSNGSKTITLNGAVSVSASLERLPRFIRKLID